MTFKCLGFTQILSQLIQPSHVRVTKLRGSPLTSHLSPARAKAASLRSIQRRPRWDFRPDLVRGFFIGHEPSAVGTQSAPKTPANLFAGEEPRTCTAIPDNQHPSSNQ